jgi:hypothetical protein
MALIPYVCLFVAFARFVCLLTTLFRVDKRNIGTDTAANSKTADNNASTNNQTNDYRATNNARKRLHIYACVFVDVHSIHSPLLLNVYQTHTSHAGHNNNTHSATSHVAPTSHHASTTHNSTSPNNDSSPLE